MKEQLQAARQEAASKFGRDSEEAVVIESARNNQEESKAQYEQNSEPELETSQQSLPQEIQFDDQEAEESKRSTDVLADNSG